MGAAWSVGRCRRVRAASLRDRRVLVRARGFGPSAIRRRRSCGSRKALREIASYTGSRGVAGVLGRAPQGAGGRAQALAMIGSGNGSSYASKICATCGGLRVRQSIAPDAIANFTGIRFP